MAKRTVVSSRPEEKSEKKGSTVEEQEVTETKQIWRPKKKPDECGPLADACMAFFLPSEFIAPESQDVQEEVYSDFDESECQDLMAY